MPRPPRHDRARRVVCAAVLLPLLLMAAPAVAEIALTPAWQVPAGGNPTGVGWADLDGDGWLDLVVTCGLDGIHAANLAFRNRKGDLQPAPFWTSADTLTSGHLALGDLDGDGDPDLVCTSMGHGPSGRAPEPHAAYLNRDGLPATADWRSPPANGFSCALGDPDGDGDLDLAVGQGFSAVDSAECSLQQSVIYFNDGRGGFGTRPGWRTDDSYIATDVAFCDIDADGDQDLALCGRRLGLAIFYNRNGALETTPSWHKPELGGGRQMAFGDVDGDGLPELALCALGAYGVDRGRFELYRNEGGFLRREPVWTCDRHPEPAAVAFADVDGDGDLDLGAGGWNTHVGVFENVGGRLSTDYVWSHTPGWLQQIAWCDLDENGLADRLKAFRGDGRRHLFDLGAKAVHEIVRVSVDGRGLGPDRWCADPVEGWLSLADAPAAGATLEVEYRLSANLDLAVTTLGRIRVYENRPAPLPRDVHLLVLLDDQFGANVNFATEHFLLGRLDNNILAHFARFGWRVTLAATHARVDSCAASAAQFGSRSLAVDTLLTRIDDLSAYDAISIMPGNRHDGLLGSPAALALIRRAVEEGLVVSAWCRGVRVLAAAGVLAGRRVVGHADHAAEYEAAGAEYLGSDHPPVIDGPVVTGVRSRFYRTEMCEAIAAAVAARR